MTVKHDGAVRTIHADAEVILSAGGISSPQLLMLSGIGDSAHLAKMGMGVVVNNPAVGANLQNHVDVAVKHRNLENTSLLPFLSGPGRYLAGLQWMLFGTGPVATNHLEVTAFIKSDPDLARADLKLTLANIAMQPGTMKPYPFHGFRVQIKLMRPKSRGDVRLRTADPLQPPAISFDYLQDSRDLAALKSGMHQVRSLIGQQPFERFAGEELSPGRDVADDESLDRWLRSNLRALSHQSGTCRMGASGDPRSVVDPNLKVIGVRGLRVAYASVMPILIAGYTAAPTMMIGEKAADMILTEAR